MTLAAYSHFGARGLKGIEMYYLVQEACRRGHLEKVIAVSKKRCGFDFDLDRIVTLPGESRAINGLIQVKQRLWRGFPSRWLGELLFDRFAAGRLDGRGGVLVTTPRLVRTTARGKALGYRTLLYGDHCDPRYLVEQIDEERSSFGLTALGENRVRGLAMKQFTAHVESSDFILALSDFARDTYVHHGVPAEKVLVAPLGVDFAGFPESQRPTTGPFTYVFVAHASGTTGIVKGLQYLLPAWAALGLADARLVICGKIGDEVRAVIGRHGALPNVEFTGPVDDPGAQYRRASVFVLPSLAEGFPKVLLEAMASGLPVITTPVCAPAVREGVDGFIVPMRDVAALKERMLHLYEHRDDVVRMGRSAAERAREFSWARFSRQIADILETAPVSPGR